MDKDRKRAALAGTTVRPPSRIPSVLIMLAWLGLTIAIVRTSDGTTWHLLIVMPGIVLAAAIAASVYDRQVQAYGKALGLEPVYKGNVHGNGSFFQGYRDPKTGKWPVNPELYVVNETVHQAAASGEKEQTDEPPFSPPL